MMQELKQEYNKLLERFYKADKWFSESNRTIEEQDKYIVEFKKVLKAITETTLALEKAGIKMTGDRFMKGFKE